MDKQTQVELAKLTDEVKKVVRRVERLQDTVDLVFKNFEILEDIQGGQQGLKEIIFQHQQHQTNGEQNLAAGIQDTKFAVEDKVEEIKKIVEDKNMIVVKEGVFKKIGKMLQKKEEK